MDDPTKDTIPRSAVEYCLRKETVNTNPEANEAHERFIAYMDDPDTSQFGHWMHSNGFNCALTAIAVDLDKIPSAQPEPDAFKQRLMIYLADLQLTYSPGWGANGCGDDKLYEFVTGLIEEIESWGGGEE